MTRIDLEPSLEFETVRIENGSAAAAKSMVATEVPFTIVANEVELATLSCTPVHLRELALGFLYTSGFIRRRDDVKSFWCDETAWRAEIIVTKTPNPGVLWKRLYTSGCGKGVMFSTMGEIALRGPLTSTYRLKADAIAPLMRFLQRASPLHAQTGGIHTAAVNLQAAPPGTAFDDVGRHNAVDKAIGNGFIKGDDLGSSTLTITGRISSDILYKAKRAGIPIILSLGAPTHQSVLLARDFGITIAGFARANVCTVFSHPERFEA
jgi:FdhD protein